MAGALLDRELKVSSGIQFCLATEKHDPEIRRLLRENPVQGDISFSFEHEPHYFKHLGAFGDVRTILAFQGERLVCMGRCSTRHRFINGQTYRVGYLGELRLDSAAQGRFDILRRGYQFFLQLHREDPLDFYFTSIAEDNHRSIRFLERGLPGMPQYQFLTRISTYFVPVPKNRLFLSRISDRLEKRLASEKLRLQGASKARLSPLATFLKKKATQHQLVSCWTEDDLINLSRAGLSIEDFQVIMDGARIVACSALWDQRAFKQTVIRSYRGKARVLRPWWNWASCILGMPGLPSEGCAVAFACLSPLMMEETDEHLFFALLESSLLNAARRNLEYIVLSLPEDSRWSALRQKIRGWKYKTKLYRVCWEEEKNNQIVLDGRPVLPELAFL